MDVKQNITVLFDFFYNFHKFPITVDITRIYNKCKKEKSVFYFFIINIFAENVLYWNVCRRFFLNIL